MKQWPEELSELQPTSETIKNNHYEFAIDCDVSSDLRQILREFLFELEKGEKFLYYFKAIDREFIARIEFAKLSESKRAKFARLSNSRFSASSLKSVEDSEFHVDIRMKVLDKPK